MDEPNLFQAIVKDACDPDVSDEWIAGLAKRLAESGELIRGYSGSTADIPSTGGPSSLTTLLCPLFLSASGLLVPKLGVPGRPAGGLDVMAQIPDYKTELEPSEVRAILNECRYAHFDAARRIAPMDGRLFAYRQSSGTQAVVPLVIASLLAKKFAVGVERVGLDLRVAQHGNFGATVACAKANASRFIRVAGLLGIQARAFVTDASRPYQPYIGRGEGILALDVYFDNVMDSWLARHVRQCEFMAAELNEGVLSTELSAIRHQFDLHLAAQGASPDGFKQLVNKLRNQQTVEIRANREGYISFELGKIRDVIVTAQRRYSSVVAFPDAAGVVLLAEPDSLVAPGQPVMRCRSETANVETLQIPLQESVTISRFPQNSRVDVVNA